MNSISVIVPTLNRPALLLQAVESAARQTQAPVEILVVDDGSAPAVDVAALGRAFGGIMRVLRNEQPQGLAWARHQGAAAARGDYVVQLDDDDLFSPSLVADCAAVLDAEPSIELAFIGVKGFGRAAEHFNRVHPAGTERVVAQGGGTFAGDGLYLFGPELIRGLLNQVPMPFQRVMARREVWHKVSHLRLAAYATALGLDSPEAARDRIRGTLRDSEWALYAALACRRTALVDRPLYLQRCDGQGRSSQAAMRQKHIQQGIEIRTVLAQASQALPDLRAFGPQITQNLAGSHFDAAYELVTLGQYAQGLEHLGQSFRLDPSLKAARLLLRLGAAWALRRRAA